MTHSIKSLLIFFGALIVLVAGCRPAHSPKPRGYFRIELPEKQYLVLDSTMPYSFEYSKYAVIETDVSQNEPNWINVLYPNYKARVHLSYKPVTDNLYDLLEDNIRLAYNHVVKADAIDEHLFVNEETHLYAMMFEIKGDAASPLQFLATDSARHFLRGSLYFQTAPNRDSLAPVIDYITEDVVHLIETLQWKD
jgi:gliding motility-associated lipoprotein GldD